MTLHRSPRTTLLALLALILLAACGGRAAPAAPAEPAPSPSPAESVDVSDAILTLHRDPCFGFCPMYTVTIYGDGRVLWEGEDYVEVVGPAEGQAEPAEVAALVEELIAIGFFEMEDSYTEQCDAAGNCTTAADLPSATISLDVGSRSKQVYAFFGTPPALEALLPKIDEVANTAQWIGSPTP